jgi:(R,R)-butanediol dehydrogenase/meso-butanediol dehydrogenase/diacetyl reductase
VRAAVFDGTGVAIEDVPEPRPRADELLVAVRTAGVCGTDLHAGLLGIRPGTVIGHEFWGEIVEVGAGAPASFAPGQAVCALPVKGCGTCVACVTGDPSRCRRVEVFGADRPGVFAELVAVGAREAFPVPTGMERLGALVEPLAVGLHTVRRARLDPTDRVLVLGAGPIGVAVVMWCRHVGVRSIVVGDPVDTRRAVAERAGASASFDPRAESAGAAHRATTGARPDVIFECVGGDGVLDECVAVARAGARVVVAGLHTSRPALDARRAFFKELEFVFAAYYSAAEFSYTIEMLDQRAVDPDILVSHRVPLDDLPLAFEELKHPTDQCKVLVEIG